MSGSFQWNHQTWYNEMGSPIQSPTLLNWMQSYTVIIVDCCNIAIEFPMQSIFTNFTLPQALRCNVITSEVIVLLDSACLETVKVGQEFQLLNCDDHKGILAKKRREIGEARPDIVHQCLLTLLDSPLNKAGHLRVFIKTTNNILINVNPQIRIPRTFKRFAGLMVQLLHKLSIKATEGGEKLMSVIKNPITDHIPAKCHKIGTSYSSKKLVDVNDYVLANFKKEPVLFIIGAFAHGKISEDLAEETISYSSYPLSASVACGKLCCAFERLWGVL